MVDARSYRSMRRSKVHAHGHNRPDQIDERRFPETSEVKHELRHAVAEGETAKPKTQS